MGKMDTRFQTKRGKNLAFGAALGLYKGVPPAGGRGFNPSRTNTQVLNLVPRAIFPGFVGGAPLLHSQGKEPCGRGCQGLKIAEENVLPLL